MFWTKVASASKRFKGKCNLFLLTSLADSVGSITLFHALYIKSLLGTSVLYFLQNLTSVPDSVGSIAVFHVVYFMLYIS